MSGWEKVARPADRAVAVMQSRSNWFYTDRFERRWGEDTLQQLFECKVVSQPVRNILHLEPPYRVREQWELEYAETHGEAGLRTEFARRLRVRIRSLEQTLADVESGELPLYPGMDKAAEVARMRRGIRGLKRRADLLPLELA